jgi:hypothetical protein
MKDGHLKHVSIEDIDDVLKNDLLATIFLTVQKSIVNINNQQCQFHNLGEMKYSGVQCV